MFKKSLLSLMMLCFAFFGVARAQSELTVYDGTATNGFVPVYGYYTDAYLKCEMVYPADELTGMTGGTISSLTFYASQANVSWGSAQFQVFVDAVNGTTLSDFAGPGTIVYEGALSISGNQMVVEFATPYTYGGGNLLVGIYETTIGSYVSSSWYGETVDGASVQGYSYSGLDAITATPRNFLPKTTFTYIPAGGAICEKPATLEVDDITGYGATCTWESEVGNYTFEYKMASETEWIVVEGLTANTYELSDLEPFTNYNVRVKAVCGEGVESGYRTASFATLDVCPDDVICIGEGTASHTALPANNYYNYSLSQQIYTAEEIGVAGAILSVDFYKANATEMNTTLDIYMVSTDKYVFDNDTDWIPVTAANLVYSGPVNFAHNAWTTIEFDVPFIYDGRSNVAIIVDNNTGDYESSTPFLAFSNGDEMYQSIYVYSDGTNYDPMNPPTGTYSNMKNRIRLIMGEPPACMKPTGVTAEVNGNQAVISWVSDATSFNIDIDGNVIEGITSTSYTFTGELATTYEVMVQADCGDDGESDWSNPYSFTTELCLPENKCAINFTVTDSYGDGWNYASIQVYEYDSENNEVGELLAEITNEDLNGDGGCSGGGCAETQTYTLNFCDGQELAIFWIEGNYDSECSYTITDLNDDVIISGEGEGFDAFAYTVNCTVTDCRTPSNFAVSEISGRSVVLSWTENGPATEWVLAYISENDTEVNYINVTTNPYTLTGLIPETMYAAQVTPVCEMEKPSEIVYWTTDVACPKPHDISVTPYPYTADVEWSGVADAYEIEWAEVPTDPAKDPYNDEGWYYYDNGTYVGSVGLGGGEFHWAIMLPAGSFEGTTLDVVRAYDVSAMVGTLAIYNDGDTAPADQLSIQDMEFTGAGAWVEFNVDVTVDPTKNVWIVFDAVDGAAYPIGTSNDDNGDANGRWVEINGNWYDMANVGVTGRANMVRAHFESINYDDLDWTTVSGITSPYTIEGLQPETNYVLRLKALCGGEDGESAWSSKTFTTPGFCDMPINLTTDDITYNSATLNWTGYQDSYNLRWWIPAHLNEFNETDFTQVGEDYTADTVLQTYTISLSGFSGVGNVAIRHYNITDMFRLNVDDIVLTNAQGQTIMSEDFESGEISMGWVNYDLDGDRYTWDIWEITQQDANGNDVGNGSYCATSASYNSTGALTPDNWLIIPNVELGGTLTFVARGQDPSYAAEVFGVFVSTNQLVVPGTDPVTVNNVTNPYELTGLTPNTPYAWQVQGVNTSCDGGVTEWAEVQNFTTLEQTNVTQTIALTAGFNWISSNVEINLDNLKAALVEALPGATSIKINSQSNGTTTYNGSRWRGQLSAMDLAQMYMVEVPTDCEMTLEGMPIDVTNHPVTIKPGQNWIAFPLSQSMSLTDAFAGFAINGDKVNSQIDGTATYTGRWRGQLTTLEAGKGYMYESAAASDRTFTFPAGSSKAASATIQSHKTTGSMAPVKFPKTMNIFLK